MKANQLSAETQSGEDAKWINLGETGVKLAWLLFVAVIEENDWKALDLFLSFRDTDLDRSAKLLAEAKLQFLKEQPLALPRRSVLGRSRSRRKGYSAVAIPARWLCVSDLARVISLRELEVAA